MFCDQHSANMQGTPTGCQFGAAHPYLPSLFAPPTNSKVDGESHPFHRGAGPSLWSQTLPVVGNRALNPPIPPRAGLAPGSHTGQFRRQQTQEGCCANPKDQKGKLKEQMRGSHRLSLKPCACCFVALGRPCFFSGPQFSSL